MKLFKNIMSRKPEPEETVGKIDLDMDVEPLRRRSDLLADDSGEPNGAARAASKDPLFADPSKPSYGRNEEPEEVAGAGWGANAWGDDDWDDDEDWGEDDFEDADDGFEAPGAAVVRARSQGNDWSEDEDFGRKAIARSQLGAGGASEDRILQKTNSKMVDRESSRRHSAMAHLKAAAAATKADRVLKDEASRDPAADPEEQSPYRDDLAKVVRPRAVSRPTTRPTTVQRPSVSPWEDDGLDDEDLDFGAEAAQGFADDDTDTPDFDDAGDRFADGNERFGDDPTERFASGADRFAIDASAFDQHAAEEEEDAFGARFDPEAVEEEKSALIPDDLSEDDFADDGPNFAANVGDRFGVEELEASGGSDAENDWDMGGDEAVEETAAFEVPDFPIAADVEEEPEETPEPETDGPVPSTAVSEAIAMANAPDEPEEIDGDEVRRKIWDLSADTPLIRDPIETAATPDEPAPEAAPEPAPEPEPIVNVAAAATTVTGRAGRSAGRVKTRLLGFQDPEDTSGDVFEAAKPVAPSADAKYPVGWIIVIDGPGHGSCFTLFNGVSQIGRGEEQAVRLDFGDTSISRNNHAAVAFDDEQTKFFLGHGGKSNLVRLNGRPVLSTEELSHGDAIRIGETTLKFVALCGDDFNWKMTDGEDANNGANA